MESYDKKEDRTEKKIKKGRRLWGKCRIAAKGCQPGRRGSEYEKRIKRKTKKRRKRRTINRRRMEEDEEQVE